MTMLVRAATLTNYQAVARRHGLSTAALLRDAGLSRSLIDNPDQLIPAAAVVTLLEATAQAARCPSFALQMAEGRSVADFGPVSLLIAHQPTLRDSLDTLIRYRRLVNQALLIRVEEFGDITLLREEITIGGGPPPRQASELIAAVLLGFLRSILGEGWMPEQVSFVHHGPADLRDHRRMFGKTIDFCSAASGIAIRTSDLDRPNPQANAALALHARQFVDAQFRPESDLLAGEVRQAIILLLPSGMATLATVAQTLGQNLRTLQRRLANEGTTFVEVLNDARRELALRYLDNRRFKMLHVAEMLGFATPAAFTRWFVAQFNVPPTSFRLGSR